MKPIQIGDTAPEFTLEAQDGRLISLAEFRGRQVVVLFFYPKDETPVCTKEACGFRDAYQQFLDRGAAVLGISSDSRDSHRVFAAGHDLPYPLLSDREAAVRKAYGVPRTLGIMPGRVTYVIDLQGVVRHICNSMMFAERHVEEALEVVQSLQRESWGRNLDKGHGQRTDRRPPT
ncbi:peroxiredoxin [Desulfuromonas versatilis]|uniref:thioredoxin-dependent peroxiredoxin n=1 Tax=Desulfuromonas versatilis TaxID=2802975 RepID=A0ABN6DU45_9BACT|nr:peroxiredoxin [Desulfuromonas versatilis]BCR03628.1 peroxiredoxin [Desulfuromonas versatilis]